MVSVAQSFLGHELMAQINFDHLCNFLRIVELFQRLDECEGLSPPGFVRDALQFLEND
jgi:hypothetical protein